MTVTGSGTNHISTFDCEGFYSNETRRIGLTLKYRPNPNAPSISSGRTVLIQVSWDTNERQFKGIYFDRYTADHSKKSECQLKFDREQNSAAFERA